MHTSHPSAFISSTFIDLKEERECVAETLRSRGLNINALDTKPASDSTSKEQILKGIRESDFVILIIGDRFGSILPSMTGSAAISITWWEYQRAVSWSKPVLAYFKTEIDADPLNHDDRNENEYLKKRARFTKFKEIVSAKHCPAYFSSAYDLAEMVDVALIATYRSGVEKLSRRNTELQSKITNLEGQLTSLQRPQEKSEALGLNSPIGSILQGLGTPPTEKSSPYITGNPILDALSKKK